jgi:hypothetical protein
MTKRRKFRPLIFITIVIVLFTTGRNVMAGHNSINSHEYFKQTYFEVNRLGIHSSGVILSLLVRTSSEPEIFLNSLSNNDNISSESNPENISIWQKIAIYYQDNILKAKILLVILAYLLISVFLLFFAIVINRYQKTIKRNKIRRIKDEYQDQLASFLFDDEAEHFEFQGIDRALNRQIFIDELRDLHANLHGETAEKLRDLYFNLGLHKDSIRKVYKRRWDIKAKGFRELAQMDVKDANDQIIKYVNSKNPILRVDAQVAMVKLSEQNPLSFLDNLDYELSYWEQINIYDTLVYHQINIDSFEPWLNNPNSSVVTFAIRMIGLFKHVQSAAQVREMLRDESPEVRFAAVQALGALEMTIYTEDLKSLFYRETEILRIIIEEAKESGEMNGSEVLALDDIYPRKIRFAIVDAMRAIATEDDIPFLSEIGKDYLNSHKIRLLSLNIIAAIRPRGDKALDEMSEGADIELKNMIMNVKENQES